MRMVTWPEIDIPDLEAHLRQLLSAIPVGYVITCGSLAEVLGDARAARWIGTWLGEHHHDDTCYCHRVVRAGGHWGVSMFGSQWQQRLLQAEGVVLTASGVEPRCVIDSAHLRTLCPQVASAQPLAKLRTLQDRLSRQVVLSPLETEPESVGGVDVSYKGNKGIAAYCHIAWPRGEKLWDTHFVLPTRFPYISGYLAFRELPLVLGVLKKAEEAGQLAKVIVVDGSGLLHPRGMGIASHLGLLLKRPTIGVTKTLLCGECDTAGLLPGEHRPVFFRDQVLGAVLRSQKGHAHPVFVCPGHLIDVVSAVKVVSPLFAVHRLPEPVYWADRISRTIARRLTR